MTLILSSSVIISRSKVKRPGKNHSQLFAMLLELKGPRKIRREYIGEVISEAKRFKRRTLADLLERRMDELLLQAAAGARGRQQQQQQQPQMMAH